jgi:uncharacterized protein
MKIFSKAQNPETVTGGRFEIEKDGEVAYLEYTLSHDVLALIHTEVPVNLRHHGLASQLAETALQWARTNRVKVDVICPSVAEYIEHHPEYADLVLQ